MNTHNLFKNVHDKMNLAWKMRIKTQIFEYEFKIKKITLFIWNPNIVQHIGVKKQLCAF